jgi:transcriptional regulator with XRE-family HTH domain
MTHETMERRGKPFVLVPKAVYERMCAALEDRNDLRAYDSAKAAKPEMVPAAIVDRLLAGDNPIRVWREHRDLTQQQLAYTSGISKPYLSQLENGLRKGAIDVLRKLAAAMRVDLEDLAPKLADRGTSKSARVSRSSIKKPVRKMSAKARTKERKNARPR